MHAKHNHWGNFVMTREMTCFYLQMEKIEKREKVNKISYEGHSRAHGA
jgi:hypothetical protein